MRGEHNERRYSAFFYLATVILGVFVLRVAEEVLVPIAIAALLAFLLSPVVIRLHRRGIGRTWAVALTAGLAFITIGGIAWVIATQALELAQELPKYETNIDAKIDRWASHHTPGLTEVSNMMDRVQREMATPDATKTPPTTARVPLPVTVEPPVEGPFKMFSRLVVPVMAPVGTALIVVVFAVAILLQREDLRDRFLNVVSSTNLNLATQVVADASERVARYLGMQLMINTGYGIFIGLGLRLIGMPNALLWGVLADRAGSRIVFLLSVALWAVSTVLLMLSHDIWALALVFAGLGAGQGGFQNASQILVLEFGGRTDLPMRIAVLNAVTSLMGAIGPLAGGLMAQYLSYPAVFWFSVIVQAASVALILWRVDEPRLRRLVQQ